ncbi:MAG: bifunctional 4-hydroxy-2-oxoglutarate aldolase/2-dehydro-3-deoxy-phosphogluconate aldolase [Chloroflexi bacterium]|nr:bifunctional 4-hydroxy-2-oxoglutarate aldolase/2-dehydro-3-deoxy-phosphogluconate aldolase [Chloroflexota bacterium]
MRIAGLGGVVVVIRLDDLSKAADLTRALLDGGVTALEFTMTNPQALEVLTAIKSAFPEFTQGTAVIGAGTVLTPDDARAALAAGAQFVVTPVSNFETIKVCTDAGVPIVPGALTPTEIINAWNAGASAIKVFPARAFGPAYFKDLREPLPFLKLIPTGGVSLGNGADFIKNGAIALGVGGNLVDKKLVAAGDWEAIRQKTAAYVELVKKARQ